MSDMSRMGRGELEAELHKWRTGHHLGAMQEDLNAMQARAVEAEAKLDEIERALDVFDGDGYSAMELSSAIYRALKGKP